MGLQDDLEKLWKMGEDLAGPQGTSKLAQLKYDFLATIGMGEPAPAAAPPPSPAPSNVTPIRVAPAPTEPAPPPAEDQG